MIDMTIKLDQSTNPITNMYTTELHVCKQQHMPTATTPVIDITFKLGLSTNPITNIYTTELYVCNQQHTPTAN